METLVFQKQSTSLLETAAARSTYPTNQAAVDPISYKYNSYIMAILLVYHIPNTCTILSKANKTTLSIPQILKLSYQRVTMRTSCNGCRALRKGCSDDCSIKPCLQWIKSPESQAHATVFLAKFYGRAGLLNLVNAGPTQLRPGKLRSLLFVHSIRVSSKINNKFSRNLFS